MTDIKAGRRLAGAQLEKVRAALAVIGDLVKWAGYEDEEPAEDAPPEKSVKSTAVKVLASTPDTLTVGGYGVVFGGFDLEGETFTPETKYHLDLVPNKPILYDHGMNTKIAASFLGKSIKVEVDDDGLWVEAELDRHAAYMDQVGELIAAGVLGWSSGSVGHLVRRENGIIKSWPIVEFSLTPTPAEPRTLGVNVLKALAKVDAAYSALFPEAEASAVDSVDGAETEATIKATVPVTEEVTTMGDETTPNQQVDVEALAESIATKAFDRYTAKLEADNAQPVATKGAAAFVKSLGDNPLKAMAHYIRSGQSVAGLEFIQFATGTKAYNDTDMNIGTVADGGYAVPTGMLNEIIARRDELSLVQALGVRKIPGKGLTVNVPLDAEADVIFAAVSEAGAVLRDAPALGQAAMTLVKYAKYIDLSWELLRDEDADLMGFINNWLARGWAATLNSLLLTEVRAGGTTNALTAAATVSAADIPLMVGKLAPEYQDGAKWVINPATFAAIGGIASSSVFTFAPTPGGDYRNPTLWGYPVYQSSYASAAAASAKSLIFANWDFVGVRAPTNLTLIRDPYTAALTGQVRIVAWFDAVFKVLQAEAVQYGTHPSA